MLLRVGVPVGNHQINPREKRTGPVTELQSFFRYEWLEVLR